MYSACMLQTLELCANEISDLSELCHDPPPLVHLGLGFNQLTYTDNHLTVLYWSVHAVIIMMTCSGAKVFTTQCIWNAYAWCTICYVGLLVTSWCSIETAEWIEVVFGTKDTFGLSYSVFWGNSGVSRNKCSSVWSLAPNSVLAILLFFNGLSTTVSDVCLVRLSQDYHAKLAALFTTCWLWCRELRFLSVRRVSCVVECPF